MKKIALFLFFAMSLSVASAQTSDSTYYKNHFYINPFDLFFKTFQVTYERDVTKSKNSIAFTGGVLLEKSNNAFELGFNTELQYRINVFDYSTSKRGFQSNVFFAPYLQFRYIEHESTDELTSYAMYDPNNPNAKPVTVIDSRDANLRGYGVGVLMGLKSSAFNNRFCFGVYGGGGAKYTDVKGSQTVFGSSLVDENYTGITPKLGFQMGISF